MRTYNEPEGTFEVTPTMAVESSYHAMNRGHVTEIRPTVVVTGAVKVRGIDYSITKRYVWTETPREEYRSGELTGRMTHWDRDYKNMSDGFRRVNTSKKPEHASSTYQTLTDIVSRVLDQVAEGPQDWRTESLRLRLLHLIEIAQDDARKAHDAYTAANNRTAELMDELSKL